MAKSKEPANPEIQIVEMQTGEVAFCILGKTPILLHKMSSKAYHELLLPKGKKTAGDKANSLKHDPLQEYRDSPYTSTDESDPTLIQGLAVWFKKGMATVATDIPGTNRSQIGRLMWAYGDAAKTERVSIYGMPQLHMSITRSADQKKTPDVRTRMVIREWACVLRIGFSRPQLNTTAIANLLSAAGIISGVGDWRNQKGSDRYGCYTPVDAGNADFKRLVSKCGRSVQEAAMQHPSFYDDETEELYNWFDAEVNARGKQGMLTSSADTSAVSTTKRKKGAA